MYILEAFTSRGPIFLTVKNVFTVNKKKVVDLHHWQRKRSFLFHSDLQTPAISGQYLDTYLRKHFTSNLALACPKKVIMQNCDFLALETSPEFHSRWMHVFTITLSHVCLITWVNTTLQDHSRLILFGFCYSLFLHMFHY